MMMVLAHVELNQLEDLVVGGNILLVLVYTVQLHRQTVVSNCYPLPRSDTG